MNKSIQLKRIISLVLCAILFVSGTYLPVSAQYIIEQQKFKDVLNTDFPEYGNEGDIFGTEIAEDLPELNEELNIYDMTSEQQKNIYSQKLAEETAEYEVSRYIVKYKTVENVPEFSAEAVGSSGEEKSLDYGKITSAGIESAKAFEVSGQKKFAVIETSEQMNSESFMQTMRSVGLDSNIEYIQPDYEMAVSADALINSQWGLNEVVVSGESVTVGANVKAAWTSSTGQDIMVAVLDTGIDTEHPDLVGSIYVNTSEILDDSIDDDGNGYIDDVYGWDFVNRDNSVNDADWYTDQWHGTHIAGIIAAQRNNIGIAGVAPGAKILPIKVFEGGVAYTSDIIAAISYAEIMGAQVVNCSWGSRYENRALEDAISASNMLFVCASGNSLYNTDHYPVYPAAYSITMDNVISVAAIDETGLLCRFSNYGVNSVDIAAPGQDIMSTWIDGEYQSVDGTSMAAAFVSGAAALAYAVGYSTAGDVKERIIESADTVTGLEYKIIDGKILNCGYAASGATNSNTTVIDIPDDEVLPVIIPNTPPAEDKYESYGAENYITYRAPMPTPRHGLQVVELGGKIYAIGGQTTTSDTTTASYSKVVEVYDPETNTWTTAASMNNTRSYFGAVVYDGKIYVMGGRYASTSYRTNAEVYNPSTNTWTNMSGTMPAGIYGFSATLVPGTNKVYVAGGLAGSSYKNTVYEFAIGTGTMGAWTTKTSLSVAVANHIAFYHDGKLYIEGGKTTGGQLPYYGYRYTLSNGTTSGAVQSWSFLADAAGILTNERFIAIGGASATPNYSTVMIHTSLSFEPGYYNTLSHLNTARAGFGAVLYNGKVYNIGGKNTAGVVGSVEMMDFGWKEKASLPETIRDYKVVELDGKIYVMGGSKAVNGVDVRSKTVYMYDTAYDEWTTLGTEMPIYAEQFSLTSAYGKIYLFGGKTGTVSSSLTNSNKIYEYNPQTDVWINKTTMNYTRYGMSTVLSDGLIYIIGGYSYSSGSGTQYNILEVYDPINNTVTLKNNLPENYSYSYSCVLNDELYVFTGALAKTIKYNKIAGTWEYINPTGYFYPENCVTINDCVYTLGSYGDDTTPAFDKYDPKANICSFYKTFNYYGYFNDAIAANNKAYIFVGEDYTHSSNLVEYTPRASAWTNKNSFPHIAHGVGNTVISENIYILGGQSTERVGSAINSIYYNYLSRYNETTDNWITLQPMTYARGGLGVADVAGKLYAIGGKNSSANALAYVEEYNPTTNTWTTKQAIPAATTEMATVSYNGKIYVFGGKNTSGTAINTVRIYNPATNSWSTGKNMPTARFGSGAAIIDGKIYVAGGFTSSTTATNALQIYDPAANTWDTSKAQLPVALGYAGVVAKDSLYAIGGFNGADEMSLVYEYSPVLNEWLIWDGPNLVRYGMGAAITNSGIYVIGGQNNHGIFGNVEFAPISSLNNEYIHFGKSTVDLSGNFARTYTDISYTTPGFTMNFSRTYNSNDTRVSLISPGWTFGFQGNVDSAGNDVVVRLPNGSGNTFKKNSDGSYTAKDSRSILVKESAGTYVLTTKDQYTYGFNAAGYMTWMKDKNGNTITITVDSAGKVTKVTDQAGRATTIAYSSNRITTITDPAGRVVQYSYASNRLSSVKDSAGYYTYYTYDANGRLAQIKDNSNAVLESVSYVTQNDITRVTAVTDSHGNVTTYSYDDNDGVLTATDSNNRVVTTWFDNLLYPVRVRDAEGKETRTEYNLDGGLNRYGEITSYRDRNGNTIYYERDVKGNVIKQVNPDGSIREYTYDNKNNLLSEKDELGKYSFYVYDNNNINLVKTAQPLNGTDVYSTAAVQNNFAITSYTYYTGAEALSTFGKTMYGLLKTTTDAEGGVTTYTYDTYGNLATVKNPLNKTTVYESNILGWIKSETTPNNNTTNYYYDKNGNLLKEVKAGGATMRSVYDYNGNAVQLIMPTQYAAAADTAATYNAHRILSSSTSPYTQAGHGYRFTFNKSGDMLTQTDPVGKLTSVTYDLYGNAVTKTMANGSIYLYEYDEMNRIVRELFKTSAQATPELLAEYEYNILSSGNTTVSKTQYFSSAETAETITTYDYAGRIVRVDRPDGTYVTNTYNSNGTIASSMDARGYTTHYSYDGLNRQIQKWEPTSGQLFSFTSTDYDKANRVLSIKSAKAYVANGIAPTTNLLYTSYTYNADGTLQQELTSGGNKTTYEYDNAGNMTAQNSYFDGNTYSRTEYLYANTNYPNKVTTQTEIVEERDIVGYGSTTTQLPLTTVFTYDANGNVLTKTNPNSVTTTYTYDLMDRQLTTSQPGTDETGQTVNITTSKTYDWAGNILTSTDERGKVTSNVYNERGFLIKVTNALSGVMAYYYDRVGRKIAEVTPSNFGQGDISALNRTEYTYDDMSRLKLKTQIYTDTVTQTLKEYVEKSYTYDGNGNLILEQDALGYINNYGTIYEYDKANRLIKEQDPHSQTLNLLYSKLYSYDAIGRLTELTDANGYETDYTYNDAGDILTITVDNSLIQTNTYDLKGNLLTSTDGAGNTTTYTYNKLSTLRTMTLPGDSSIASYTVAYKYTRIGLPAESLDSVGKQTVTTYDNHGRVLTMTEKKFDNTQAITMTNAYDKIGNLRYATNGNGDITEYTYDNLNRNITTTATVTNINNTVAVQTTTYTYDANGNNTSVQSWRGNTHSYAYDALNRLIQSADPYGNIIEKLTYNNNGVQISSTDALNHTIVYTYDRNNRQTGVTDAEGNTKLQHYDGAGNADYVTDGEGNTTTYYYDGFNRLTGVENALSEMTSYTYDNAGNLISQTDEAGLETTMGYNVRNLQTSRSLAAGYEITYTYTADGKVATTTDMNGVETVYAYDIHGRSLLMAAGEDETAYTYDNVGNQLTVTGSGSTITRTYDELGRVKSKTVSGAGTTTYLYDVTAGVPIYNTATVTTDPKSNVKTEVYDRAGRLAKVTAGIDQTTYTYMDNGNLLSMTYPTGVSAEYTYYDNNKLHTLANKKGSAIRSAYNYTYDANGNLIATIDSSGTTVYTYDEIGRLESATDSTGKETEYTYDGSGNRLTETATHGSSLTETLYSYDNTLNRLMTTEKTLPDGTVHTTHYGYDGNGNMISSYTETLSDIHQGDSAEYGLSSEADGYTLYEYDVWNRMIEARADDSISQYSYNGEGLRTGKTVTEGGDTERTTFLYEYSNVVLELDESGAESAYNVYGNDTLISRTADNITYYYLYNGHGDVVQLTDTAGAVVMTYNYDAFGVVIQATGSVVNSFMYCGYRYDSETEMYYLNARYYHPAIGRFTSADTYVGRMTDPLSLNLYTYCYNNPLIYHDPTGHVVTEHDLATRTPEQIQKIQKATDDWNKANAAGNEAGKAAAHAAAEAARAETGKNNSAGYTTDDRGYTTSKSGSTNVYLDTSDTKKLASNVATSLRDEYIPGMTQSAYKDLETEITRYFSGQVPNGAIAITLLSIANTKASNDINSNNQSLLDYALMAQHIYNYKLYDVTDTNVNSEELRTISGGNWMLIELITDKPGIIAGIYENTKNAGDSTSQYAMVFMGSKTESDYVQDGVAYVTPDSVNMVEAKKATEKFVKDYDNSNVIFIGHSKGGGEAIYAAIQTGKNAITFNAANFDFGTNKAKGRIDNYYVTGEWLSETIGVASIGNTHWLPTKYWAHPNNPNKFQAVPDSKTNHKISTVVEILEETIR